MYANDTARSASTFQRLNRFACRFIVEYVPSRCLAPIAFVQLP